MDYPIVCRQCLEAPCISACPVGALYRDEQGIVRLNKDVCSRCGSCAEACPYDAVSLNPFDGTPLICDLCGGNPMCVRRCPTNALSLYPLTEITIADPNKIGKRYRVAVNEYRRLLEGWGVGVRYE
ncbi:MAG: 4Fe-4S dicluster domain-containing protein [Zestosphaera sp.]